MPTQNQRVRIGARSAIEWTECYFPFRHNPGDIDEVYHQAVERTETLLRSELPHEVFTEVDLWLREQALKAPSRTLNRGEAWGRLHEHLTGRRIAPGMVFEAPVSLEDPWNKLAETGHFGAAGPQSMPRSFVVSPLWEQCVRRSMNKHGATWLHHLALGIMAFDRDELTVALGEFEQSNVLAPN